MTLILMKVLVPAQGALRDHVQQLERENEELQHKYQDALDHSHTLELEKKEMQKEVLYCMAIR